jgi:hypothetical protein
MLASLATRAIRVLNDAAALHASARKYGDRYAAQGGIDVRGSAAVDGSSGKTIARRSGADLSRKTARSASVLASRFHGMGGDVA